MPEKNRCPIVKKMKEMHVKCPYDGNLPNPSGKACYSCVLYLSLDTEPIRLYGP